MSKLRANIIRREKLTHREKLARSIESDKKELRALELSAAEEIEKWRIQQDPDVRKYYAAIFSSLSEAFSFANLTAKEDFSEIGFFRITADFFKQAPFAAAALSRTGKATEANLLDQLSNISDFSANGEIFNPTIFLEKLARRMAVSNQDEIVAASKGERKDQLKQIRSFFRQVEKNSGRDFCYAEWLAMQDSEALVRYLKTQNELEIFDTKSKIAAGDYESLIYRITAKVLGKYSELAVDEDLEAEEDAGSQSMTVREIFDEDENKIGDKISSPRVAGVEMTAQPSSSPFLPQKKFLEGVGEKVKDDGSSANLSNKKRSSRCIIS